MQTLSIQTKVIGDLYLDDLVVTDASAMSSQDSNANYDSSCSSFGQNSRAYGHSTVAYTDNSFACGESTVAGTRAFRIVSGDMEEMSWELKSVDGLKSGMQYSVRLINNYSLVGSILNVDPESKKISVDSMPPITEHTRYDETLHDPYLLEISSDLYEATLKTLRGHAGYTFGSPGSGFQKTPVIPEGFPVFDDYDADVNTLWILGHPDLGDLSSYSTAAAAFGCGSQAEKQYSFAEGVETRAHGKYSHAEGVGTIAGYAAHSQGINSFALGNGSFAAGENVSALGQSSIAVGLACSSDDPGSFTFASDRTRTYRSHGEGTFNISPHGGVNGFYVGNQRIKNALQINTFRDFIVDNAEFVSCNVLSSMQADFSVEAGRYGYLNYSNGNFIPTPEKNWGVASFSVESGQMVQLTSYTNWLAGIVAFDENGDFIDSWHHDTNNKDRFNFIEDQHFDSKSNQVIGLKIIVPENAKTLSISHMAVFKPNGDLNKNSGLVVKRGSYQVTTGLSEDKVIQVVDAKINERLGSIDSTLDSILGE